MMSQESIITKKFILDSLDIYINNQINSHTQIMSNIPDIDSDDIFTDNVFDNDKKTHIYSAFVTVLFRTLRLIFSDIKIFVPKQNKLFDQINIIKTTQNNNYHLHQMMTIINDIFNKNKFDHRFNANFLFFNYNFYVKYTYTFNKEFHGYYMEFSIHKYNIENSHWNYLLRHCEQFGIKCYKYKIENNVRTEDNESFMFDPNVCPELLEEQIKNLNADHTHTKQLIETYNQHLISNKTILESELRDVCKFAHPIIYLNYLLSKPHDEILNYFKKIDKYKFDELSTLIEQKNKLINDLSESLIKVEIFNNDKINKITTEYNKQISDLSELFVEAEIFNDASTNKITTEHNNQIENIKLMHNDQITKLTTNYETEINDQKNIINNMTTKLDEQLIEINKLKKICDNLLEQLSK